jgi:Ca-activated chloride channel family protein
MFSSTTLKGCKLLQIIKFMANLLMRSNLAISVFFESPPLRQIPQVQLSLRCLRDKCWKRSWMCSPKKALEFSSALRWLAVRLDRKFWGHFACVSFALAVFGLFSNFALAQTTPEGKSQQTAAPAQGLQQGTVPTFQAHADLVLIPVTVTDNLNRFVLGLQKQDFQLFEDGVEQNISLFSGEDAPLSLGMLFDKSTSMAYKLGSSRDAATQLLTALNKEDEAFLVEFADIANLSVGFTARTEEIRSALKSAKASGQTALLDAIETGLVEMKDAKNSRKAIVVISDGGDNRSHYTAAQIESLVREADVQIYVMGVFEPVFTSALTPEEISGPRLLSEIATQTGGRAFAASAPADMPSVATRIAVELRNQYVLGYYPKNKARNGRYRNVEVKISQPPGIGSLLKVHWRLGYYAPGQ